LYNVIVNSSVPTVLQVIFSEKGTKMTPQL